MEILAQILSFLPIKRAASTTILSKRWKTLFLLKNHLSPSLCLDDSDLLYPKRQREKSSVVHDNGFRDFVDKTLSCCNNKTLKVFSLKFRQGLRNDSDRTIGWISKALEQGVSDLDLRITMPVLRKPPILVPETLFINKTLVKLTLGTKLCLGKAPLKGVCLPKLKSLFLHTVWFRTSDVCDEMIGGCPELEELYIHHNYVKDREDISTPYYIAHGRIKKLTIRYNDDVLSPRFLSIFTRNLVYLDYSDYLSCDYDSTDYFSALLEARLNLVFPRNGRCGYEEKTCSKIMDSICNVQTLHLSSSTVEVLYASLDLDRIPSFMKLTTLHFESKSNEYWKLLCIMIEKSPNLESLVLKGLCGISDCGVHINGGNAVKVVEIQDYKGRLKELNQVMCFLWEMENLEEMKVSISDKTANKLQLTTDLLALPKRSSKCSIHVF